MREVADRERIESFMRALGREATAPGHVYFTGGATAVLFGWRSTTIDVDIKIVPDQDAVLRAIPALKESLRRRPGLRTASTLLRFVLARHSASSLKLKSASA